jgi:hypothetical protein
MATEKKAKKSPGRKPAPENESKNDKFVRLASPRVTKAIKTIRTIANLGSVNYERTAEQVDKIILVLTAELASLKKALDPERKGAAKADVNFQL